MGLFASDSDTDSISVTSTVASERLEEYAVEKILAEERSIDDGIMRYLTKWEGYPLSEATWEPAENFGSEEPLLTWSRHKQLVKEGKEVAFDVSVWETAVEDKLALDADKARRRKAKRRKLGIAVSASTSKANSVLRDSRSPLPAKRQATPPQPRSPAKRIKPSEVKRKGVARKLETSRTKRTSDGASSSEESSEDEISGGHASSKVRRKGVARKLETGRAQRTSNGASLSEESSEEDDSSGGDSLLEELAGSRPIPQSRTRSPRSVSASASVTAPAVKKVASPRKSPAPPPPQVVNTSSRPTEQLKTALPVATRKSAPTNKESLGTAKRTSAKTTNVMANWGAEAKKRKKRVDGEALTDIMDQGQSRGFKSLGIQHGFHKAGRNEPAPNLSDLTILDTRTGKPVAPKATAAAATSRPEVQPQPLTPVDPSGNIQSAYRRRTPPPPDRQRTVTPPSDGPAVPRPSTDDSERRRNSTVPVIQAPKPAVTRPPLIPVDPSGDVQSAFKWPTRPPPAPQSTVTVPSDRPAVPRPSTDDGTRRRNSTAPITQVPEPAVTRPQMTTSQSTTTVTNLSSVRTGPAPTRSASGDIHSAYLRRTPAPPPRERTPTPPPPPPPPPTGPMFPDVDLKQKTCYFWKQGHCNKSEAECRFSHYETGMDAAPPSAIEQAQRPSGYPVSAKVAASNRPTSTKELTCSFWAKGKCGRPEAKCVFAHRDTGTYASPNLKKVTCQFWAHGGCLKTEKECIFAHRDTGLQVIRPGSISKANETPLASRGMETPIAVSSAPPRSLQTPATNTAPTAQSVSTDPRLRQPQILTNLPMVQPHRPDQAHFTASPINVNDSGGEGIVRPVPPPNASRRGSSQYPPNVAAVKVDAMLSLLFAPNDHYISDTVSLETMDLAVLTRFAGPNPRLRVERVALTSDIEELLWKDRIRPLEHCSGGIAPGRKGDLDNIVDLCKMYACGLIARPDGHSTTMIIYPSSNETWKFIEQDCPAVSQESVLRFRMFQQIADLDFTSVAPLPSAKGVKHATIIGEEVAGLDRDLLMQGDVRTVFLMIPPTQLTELEVLKAYFQSNDCKVYLAGTPGAWEYFRKKCRERALVIFHADVPLQKVPGLYDYLMKASGSTYFLTIGVNRPAWLLDLLTEEPEYGLTRMFPLGSVIFITDDVLVYFPQKALEVISAYNSAHKPKPEGGEFSKIAARPGLKDFVMNLALKSAERGAPDQRFDDLYKAVCTLCPDDDEEPVGSGIPSLDSNLISIDPELLPTFQGLWERDEAASTDYIVGWFAGWCTLNASRFRKFMVCHETRAGNGGGGRSTKGPGDWAAKYQHIGVVSAESATELFRIKQQASR